MRTHIRWMIKRDMPEVLGIERASFGQPWSEDDFGRTLRQRHCIGMVAERTVGDAAPHAAVVGFMVYELYNDHLAVLDFAVHPDHRRAGVGMAMAGKLAGKLSNYRRTRLRLNVRETNLAAQLFFSKLGFRATSVVREHYPDTGEDAYAMEYAPYDAVTAYGRLRA